MRSVEFDINSDVFLLVAISETEESVTAENELILDSEELRSDAELVEVEFFEEVVFVVWDTDEELPIEIVDDVTFVVIDVELIEVLV